MNALFVVITLVCILVVVLSFGACMYYLSPYALDTKRGFIKTMRKPCASVQYRLGQALKRLSKESGQAKAVLRFDVKLKLNDTTYTIDCISITPYTMRIISVIGGNDTVSGTATGKYWVAYPKKATNDNTTLMPNMWVYTKGAKDALVNALALSEAEQNATQAHIIVSNKLDISCIDLENEGSICRVKEARKALKEPSDVTDVVFSQQRIEEISETLNQLTQINPNSPEDELLSPDEINDVNEPQERIQLINDKLLDIIESDSADSNSDNNLTPSGMPIFMESILFEETSEGQSEEAHNDEKHL